VMVIRELGVNGVKSVMTRASQELLVTVPCGDCKFLERKCTSECIFATYFGTDHGAGSFAAVHKVFCASNVS
jgi:hypothetical protein